MYVKGVGGTQSINKSIKSNPQKAPHEHKRSHIPEHPHGQQTPRREASQAWGAKSESRKRVSLRDSLFVYTLFTEDRSAVNPHKTAEENHLRCTVFLRKKKETRGLACLWSALLL